MSPGSPFMHVLRLSSLRPAEVGLKLKHRTGAQAHRMLCLTLGCVGCQFGTPNEPDPHKIDGLPSLAGSWINLSLSLSLVLLPNEQTRPRISSSLPWTLLRRRRGCRHPLDPVDPPMPLSGGASFAAPCSLVPPRAPQVRPIPSPLLRTPCPTLASASFKRTIGKSRRLCSIRFASSVDPKGRVDLLRR